MKVFVFLIQRPQDSSPWPTVYTDLSLAEKAFGRVSAITPVELTAIPRQPIIGYHDERVKLYLQGILFTRASNLKVDPVKPR